MAATVQQVERMLASGVVLSAAEAHALADASSTLCTRGVFSSLDDVVDLLVDAISRESSASVRMGELGVRVLLPVSDPPPSLAEHFERAFGRGSPTARHRERALSTARAVVRWRERSRAVEAEYVRTCLAALRP